MPERDDDERRDENQEAAAAAAGALLGSVAGTLGAIAGAWLGPKLRRLVRGVWAELSESARQQQTDVLFWAIRNGVPVDEMEARINASKRTQLLTGLALDAAWQTAWTDKLPTLGRSLACGLLAEDNATIDIEQMIIVAIADIEAPHLALLELLVRWTPRLGADGQSVTGPLDVPAYSFSRSYNESWQVHERKWNLDQITYIRPSLSSITPSLLGTLQRHGLVVQNDNTAEAVERYAKEFEKDSARYEREGGARAFHPSGPPHVAHVGRLIPPLTWSPTELGEKVFLRFLDAGTGLADVWTSGPADQQK